MCLQEILGNNLMFGGMNMLLFGDLMQLPPVKAYRVFEDLQSRDVSHSRCLACCSFRTRMRKSLFQILGLFGGIAANANLFNLFSYEELEENMRQAGDLEFAQLLGRVRVQDTKEEDKTVRVRRMWTKKS